MPASLRSTLPPGAAPVAGALVAASVTTYAFLALTARVLGPERFAPISVLWSAVFLVVPSVWGPLEQEVARRVAGRAARGRGARPVMVAGARVASWFGVPVVVVLTVSVPWTGPALFSGWSGVAGALAAAVVGFSLNHLTRAALAGSGRFWPYGWCIALDSSSRLAAAIALAVAGVRSPVPYAFAVAVAPVVPVVVFRRRWSIAAVPGPQESPPEIARAVLPLTAAQVLAQALVNGGPLLVAALAATDDQAVVGSFLAALVIARIPLFFFQAVQSSLLPALARLHALGNRPGFVRQARRLLVGVAGLAVAAVAAAAAFGPTVVGWAFGTEFTLGRRDLAMLAAAAGLYMVGVVASHGLVALAGHRLVLLGWASGVAVAGSTVAAGQDLLWRVEAGLVLGTAAGAAVHCGLLWWQVSAWRPTPHHS